MKSAAPQMPAGRRPVCIQSRFMDFMSCRLVAATCDLAEKRHFAEEILQSYTCARITCRHVDLQEFCNELQIADG